jgi:dienelactone hydrolase
MVVAAPAFPLQNAHTPGGPVLSDIVNQPADMRVVISRMLAHSAAAGDPLGGTIEPRQIAVGGHSNGGSTASAVAYDPGYSDPRVSAAVLLSGARLSGGEDLRRGSPALLAIQGTGDPINPPGSTYAFFNAARRPKFLLKLLGAGHETPYTYQQPQLGVVERVSIAFFDRYLRGRRDALSEIVKAGRRRAVAALVAQP